MASQPVRTAVFGFEQAGGAHGRTNSIPQKLASPMLALSIGE
jgi:hypothetical protein